MGHDVNVATAGIIFLLSLTVAGWTGVVYILTPCFLPLLLPLPAPLTLQAHRFYRRVTHFVQWAWMGLVVLLLEKLFGIHVQIYGDRATKAKEAMMKGERAMWLSNHRTRIDWMLLWSVAFRTGMLDQLKIVLKAPLRKIPIFGWAMQHFIFIFLQRRWADDQVNLQKLLPFLTTKEPNASYLLFPEGTDLSESNLERNTAFAEKNNLLKRAYSLYPRTTGWTFMFPLLRQNLSAVYDITMFYVDYAANERPSEASLLSGRMPRMIYFYIERVDIREVGDSDAELAQWVEARFTRKEELLKSFYEANAKLPADAQLMFQEDLSMSFAQLGSFWIVVIVLALRMSWAFGVWSILYTAVVSGGYMCSTMFFSGVDGFLLQNF